jgi:hypothetical protein
MASGLQNKFQKGLPSFRKETKVPSNNLKASDSRKSQHEVNGQRTGLQKEAGMSETKERK